MRTYGEGVMNNLKAYLKIERKNDLEEAVVLDKRIQSWMAFCEWEGRVGWPGSQESEDRELERAQGGLWGQDWWVKRYERR